jgi:rRNA-processing protein EBP2
MPAAENEPDLFDVSLEDSATTAKKDREARRSAGGGAPNAKRQKKDAKYGYGGKKRFSKSGDAESAADMRSHPGKGMGKTFKGGAGKKNARPGKSKRAGAKLR